MKARSALVIVILAATALPTASAAHPIDRFDACAKARGSEDVRCTGKTEVGKGVEVVIRAELAPPHARTSAWVLRLRPHADRWERVALVGISKAGSIRWFWTPRERHIHNYTAWRFRFKVPHHVRSDEF